MALVMVEEPQRSAVKTKCVQLRRQVAAVNVGREIDGLQPAVGNVDSIRAATLPITRAIC